MMLPVSRFRGQPVGMVTAATPWLSICNDPMPRWLWLSSWSAATFQATPPLMFYSPAVWIPEHTQQMQWECPALEVVPVPPPFYHSSPLHLHSPLPKLAEGWTSPEEMGAFQRRDKPFLPISQIIQRPGGHVPRSCLLLSPALLPGRARRKPTKTRHSKSQDSSSSSSFSFSLPVKLHSQSPLVLPLLTTPPSTNGAVSEWAQLQSSRHEDIWPLILPNRWQRSIWLRPVISCDREPSPSTQLIKEVDPSIYPSRLSSGLTLLTDCRHGKRGTGGGKVSYGEALLFRTERGSDDNKQCVDVSVHKGEDQEEGRKDKRPVASTPVPGSPWCVVWTGDDRVFFFNPTIHLSVWERPGELIGHDIKRIIDDPPHKRKKTTPNDSSSSCQSSGPHGNDEEDDDDHQEHSSKRNKPEDSLSIVPPNEVKLLPQELRISHFREMLLERGVSAFSTWEKELHKMVFDPRYLLLTSDQRKQVFDQFVKSRVKDEYKEKKNKLQKAREEFKQLLEEAKITNRSTFKEFCAHYRGDQRFTALNRKKEQELIFNHHITSLKKRDKENRSKLRKMR